MTETKIDYKKLYKALMEEGLKLTYDEKVYSKNTYKVVPGCNYCYFCLDGEKAVVFPHMIRTGYMVLESPDVPSWKTFFKSFAQFAKFMKEGSFPMTLSMARLAASYSDSDSD